jgi:serine/threonine protein kinase
LNSEDSDQNLDRTTGFSPPPEEVETSSPPEFLGHYRIEGELGRGGMGVVYLGRDSRLQRQVAIKVLPQSIASDAKALARFEQEARILATLDHPNIATIYSLEQDKNVSFITLQLIPGETLAARLSKGPLTLEDAVDIGMQTASALEAAHEKGVIHRDLKPANIQVTPEGAVRILDFGLAQVLRSDSLLEDPPEPVTGTLGYMSPEQLKAFPPDVRADIWSFGCILYECVTGRKAFDGSGVSEVFRAILSSNPDMNELPEGIRELVERCLRKDPSERWPAFSEVTEALEKAVAGKGMESILSETMGRALSVGQAAPSFMLSNSDGVESSLKSLIATGPVILHFYRGAWCPFCTAELEALSQNYLEIVSEGASLVAISPQLSAQSRALRTDKSLAFELLYDPGNRVADLFGIRFAVPDADRDNYRGMGLDLGAFNGDDSWTLPLPARFVIDQLGIIRDAMIQTDITVRPNPQTGLDIARSLRHV